jgi:hypothetical protein
MAYCDKCRNLYNITDKITTAVQPSPSEGGSLDKHKIKFLINNLLSDDDIELYDDIKNIDMNNFFENKRFTDLSDDDQHLIKKKIKKILSGGQSAINQNESNVESKSKTKKNIKTAYYICTICGHYKPIDSKTIVYTKMITESEVINKDDLKLLVNDYTLPRTKNYSCINTKCATNKNPQNKEAIIYRDSQYRPLYICNTCQSVWYV